MEFLEKKSFFYVKIKMCKRANDNGTIERKNQQQKN